MPLPPFDASPFGRDGLADPAEWSPRPVRRFMLHVNGVDLLVRDTGPGLPPLLCLHGCWGRGEAWMELGRRLGGRYRIIAPDQRGHGLSGRPRRRCAPEDLADDARMLLAALGAGPAILVGHGMGGRVAAVLAARHPEAVRALALLDVAADGPEEIPERSLREVSGHDGLTSDWPTPYPSLAHALGDLRRRWSRESGVAYFRQSLCEHPQGYDFMFSRWMVSCIQTYSHGFLNLLPRIACPVLLVRGRRSPDLSAAQLARMAALLPRPTCVEIAGADHFAHLDHPPEFELAFEAWLAGLEEALHLKAAEALELQPARVSNPAGCAAS